MFKSFFKNKINMLVMLVIAFLILYFIATGFLRVEKYEDLLSYQNTLIPKDKLIVIQGNGVPDVPIKPSDPDTTDTLFNFAYNKCSLECCKNSEYSCNGGCVCLTPEQLNMNKSSGCSA